MKKITLSTLGLLLSLSAFAGGGTVTKPPPQPEDCFPITTIDGSHNQDCGSEAGTSALANASVKMPNYAKIRSNLVLEGTFISNNDSGDTKDQVVTISIVATPKLIQWSGEIYYVEYDAILATSNLGEIKATKIVLTHKTEDVRLDFEINGDQFRLFYPADYFTSYNISLRTETRLFKLKSDGSQDSFSTDLDPAKKYTRLRTGPMAFVRVQQLAN